MTSHEAKISSDLGVDAPLPWVHEPRCDECRVCTRENRILPQDLADYVSGILVRHGVPQAEAQTTARILVASDTRGIQSHGVARLGRYLKGIEAGTIVPGVEPVIEEPAPAIALVDARNGLGQVIAEQAMDLAIRKASAHGVGLVTVRHSNHYGIAGYYALRAAEQGMIGLSLTNSAPLVVPTFGADVVLGTNPIAFGAPAKRHPPFLLDMATSVVPRGKLEVYDRNRMQMPAGWTVDEHGYDCPNPGQVIRNLVGRLGGGILPLGGRGTEFSGHKGYGLGLMVDILAGVLSGAAYGTAVSAPAPPTASGAKSAARAPDVGHFFLALDVARFMDRDAFEERLDDLMDVLKGSRKALDQAEIYIHGEKSWAKVKDHEAHGIPIAQNVLCALESIARACGQPPPPMQADRVAGAPGVGGEA